MPASLTRFTYSALALAALMASACSSSKNITRPMESYAATVAEKRSVISIPVELKVSRLEKTLNEQLNGMMYEDNSFEDGDRMMIKVVKRDWIKLQVDPQRINFSIPAVIGVKYDAGFTTVEANGEIAIDLSTSYSIKPDWSVTTRTDITNHRWLKQPVMRMAGINLPVGLIADLVIKNTRRTLTKAIDEAVAENFKLNSIVGDTWKTLFQPSLVSEEYNAWLLVNPQSIGMTPIRVARDTLTTTLVVEARPSVKVGQRPNSLQPLPLPAFTQYNYQAPGFEINLATEVSFAEAQRIAREELGGETFTSGKRSVTVEDVEIFGQNDKVIIGTRLSGSYNGSIYLSGKPFYNRQRNTIEIDDLDFTLETKNFLLKSGAWLVKSTLKKKIQENMDFYLNYNLEEAKKQLQSQMNNYRLGQGIKLESSVDRLDVSSVQLIKEGFYLGVVLGGLVKITVDQSSNGNGK